MSETKLNNLYSPGMDLFLLGGGSLFALIAIRLLSEKFMLGVAWSASATMMLANFVNHPHFACSYQIFYSDFKGKLFSVEYEKSLRYRYFMFGVVAPVVLACGMAWMVVEKNAALLGLAANLMFLLVGWHYVKQGYGMAMLDASLKRAFFGEREKKALLINAYAVWLLAWLFINFLAKNQSPNYFGIPYVALPVPGWVLALFSSVAGLTTLYCTITLYRMWRHGRPVALNGVIAYAVSLYAWLLVRDPIVVLWVPLFHSLQYLAVVWRFQVNRCKAASGSQMSPGYRVAAFFALSFLLGYYVFIQGPAWLDENVPYDHSVFGNSLFFFLFWVFVNIHHYFLDTVMWRKGNKDVKNYLFL